MEKRYIPWLEQNILWVVIGIISLLFSVGFLGLGLYPDDPSYLDWSWKLALHHFFLNKKVFGQEVIFSYGPYGFLYSKIYFPGTYFLTVTIWLFFSLVFWWASFELAYKMLNKFPTSIKIILSLIWFSSLFLFCTQEILADSFFVCFSVFLLIYRFYFQDSISNLTLSLTISLALICLIKFSFTGFVGLVILLITIKDLTQKKKPTVLLTFLSSVLILWLLASQPLTALPAFVRNGFTVSQYYSEQAWSPALSEILIVIGIIGLILLPIFINEWKKIKQKDFLPLLGFLGLLQLAFKAGYTRADFAHVFTTNRVMILIALCYLMICFYQESKFYIKGLTTTALVISIILLHFNLSWYLHSTLAQAVQIRIVKACNNYSLSLSSAGEDLALYQKYKEKVLYTQKTYPLSTVEGSVDFYSARQSALLVHSLDYQPRPVFQSYLATPSYLAELNAQHLKTEMAAKNIFFEINPIDGRFPSLEDGLSWPELLTRYDIKAIFPKYNLSLMQRTKDARSYSFTPENTKEITFNQEITVPTTNKDPLWLKINIQHTLFGKIVGSLWREPIIYLQVNTLAGGQFTYYLPPEMAQTGFLLSPIVQNGIDFAKLASDNLEKELDANKIRSIKILVERDQYNWCFRPNIAISFSYLIFPKQHIDFVFGQLKEEQKNIQDKSKANEFITLSLTQINAGDFTGAVASCQKAISLDPDNAIAYNNMCVAYNDLQLWDQAISAAEKALTIDPSFQLAKNNLAWAKSQKAKK